MSQQLNEQLQAHGQRRLDRSASSQELLLPPLLKMTATVNQEAKSSNDFFAFSSPVMAALWHRLSIFIQVMPSEHSTKDIKFMPILSSVCPKTSKRGRRVAGLF